MKKTFTLIMGCMLLTGICFFIYSCTKKDAVVINSSGTTLNSAPDDLLQAAKDWHAQQIKSPTIQGETNVLSITTAKPKGKLLPNWKEAKLEKPVNGQSLIVVQSAAIKLGSDSKESVIRKFVFSTYGNNITNGKIIEIYGATDYISKHKDQLLEDIVDNHPNDFTGGVIVYDVNYNFLGSKVFSNGVLIEKSSAKIKSTKHNISNKNTQSLKTLDDGSECIDYYYVTYSEGIEIFEQYLYNSCDGNGDNELGGDPTNNSNTGSYGDDVALDTDCASFNFKKTSTANWQEAGVTDIRLKWVWLGGNLSGMSRTQFLPSYVFGLPTQYQNSNGTITTLSSSDAADKAAAAVEAAKQLTYTEFRDSPYSPTDAQVLQYFKTQLQAMMALQQGTAGATGSGSPNISFKEEERTIWFPNGC